MNAAAIGRVPVDGRHIEIFGMVPALHGKFAVINRTIEVNHGRHSRVGRFVGACVVHKISAGGCADQHNLPKIQAVFGAVRFDPANGGIYIGYSFREVGSGCEAIVDAEPRKSGVGQWLKERSYVSAATAFVETSTMDRSEERRGGEECRSRWTPSH